MYKPFYKTTEKPPTQEADPKITIPLDIMCELTTAVRTTGKKHEILLLGMATYNETINTYHIEGFVAPPQTENTGAYVTTDDDAYPKWISELPREQRQKLRVHLHTHPGGVTPSGVDETTLKATLDDLDDFYIRIITNQAQCFKVDLFEISKHRMYEDLPIYVETKQIKIKLSLSGVTFGGFAEVDRLDTELNKNITVKKYVAPPHAYTQYGAYGVRTMYEESDYNRNYLGVRQAVTTTKTTQKKPTKAEIKKKKLDEDKAKTVQQYKMIEIEKRSPIEFLEEALENDTTEEGLYMSDLELYGDVETIVDILKQKIKPEEVSIVNINKDTEIRIIRHFSDYLKIRHMKLDALYAILIDVLAIASVSMDKDIVLVTEPEMQEEIKNTREIFEKEKQNVTLKQLQTMAIKVRLYDQRKVAEIRELEKSYDIEEIIEVLKKSTEISPHNVTMGVMHTDERYMTLRKEPLRKIEDYYEKRNLE